MKSELSLTDPFMRVTFYKPVYTQITGSTAASILFFLLEEREHASKQPCCSFTDEELIKLTGLTKDELWDAVIQLREKDLIQMIKRKDNNNIYSTNQETKDNYFKSILEGVLTNNI